MGNQTTIGAADHAVVFYDEDRALVTTAGSYLSDALGVGQTAIVIATPAHRTSFAEYLAADGHDVDAVRAQGRYVDLDAAEILAAICHDGHVDADRFSEVVGGLIRAAAGQGHEVRAYGEMVGFLWDQGDVAGALELETHWNDLARQTPFALYCSYHATPSPDAEGRDEALAAVCKLHTMVIEPPPAASTTPASRSFACTADEARAARRFVSDTLSDWGHAELVDDALVVVTELATNAILHAATPFTVTLSRRTAAVRIAVRDASTRPPAPRQLTAGALTGRGLSLVGLLSQRWGTQLFTAGKVVWAELRP